MDFNLPNFNTAMLIGTWELELKELFIKIFKKQYDDIICIGAAEGYYAVGFARKYPSANIHAFESQKSYRELLLNLSQINCCSNININSTCTHDSLFNVLNNTEESPLIICDIEGGEIELLDLEKIDILKKSSILVEIHEMYVANCEVTLIERFKNTHSHTVIKGRHRSLDDYQKKT